MTHAELRAYQANLDAANVLSPETQSALAEARRLRDQAQAAWHLADREFAASRDDDYEADEKLAQEARALEAAERRLFQLKSKAQSQRDAARRAVKAEYQKLVDERTVVTTAPLFKVRVFADAAQREAAYRGR